MSDPKKVEPVKVEHPIAIVAPTTTEKGGQGFWDSLGKGFKQISDELALFGGGAVGGVLAHYLASRGQHKKAEVLGQAQKLYAEGKNDEARKLITDSKAFGIGYGDEAGMLYVQGYVVQFFLHSGEEHLIGPMLDALEALDYHSKGRLALVLGEIHSPEERGNLVVSLARTPGDLAHRIKQHFDIARIKVDPAHEPGHIVGQAINEAFTGHRGRVNAVKAGIRQRRADRQGRLENANNQLSRFKKFKRKLRNFFPF